MTRILIDPQTFVAQEFGGISRYFTELCIKLKKNRELELLFPILYTDNIHYIESPFFNDSFQNKNAFLIKYSKIFRPYSPRKLKKKSKEQAVELLESGEFDLFIPTYYEPYFLPHLNGKPFVLTVHDMIHEIYPQYFIDDPQTISNKKKLIKKATRIIAVSENTKKDILRIYPNTPSEKIDVVYLAHQFSKGISDPVILPEKYILFVGNRTIYKNFTFFISAVAPLFHKSEDLHLVCAGGNPFDENELALLNELGISSRTIQQNFKDAELKTYYQKACCFVFPSEYEGFGIPVLEAMSAGCPIVLTNNSSFPEIAGDAGIYFSLNDEIDLREKISLVLNSEEIRAKYKKRGLIQARKFSWQKTTDETFKVYQKALGR